MKVLLHQGVHGDVETQCVGLDPNTVGLSFLVKKIVDKVKV